jgi:hypothetical protein
MKINILIILSLICFINSYILPQTYREWTVIGIDKNININKPYHYHIGSLPMVLWYNKTNPQTIINTCHKHLGNTLKESYIENNELICPFHKNKYTNNDNLGDIRKSNGLLWWSYKSFKKFPPKINDENNNYHFQVKGDFISIILNFINDFHEDKDKYMISNHKILMKKDRKFLIYKYPYSIKFSNIYMMNIIPIDYMNSNVYITTSKNIILNEDDINKFKSYIERRIDNFKFKHLLLLNDNSLINKIYNLYNKYMFPDDISTKHFLLNRRYY